MRNLESLETRRLLSGTNFDSYERVLDLSRSPNGKLLAIVASGTVPQFVQLNADASPDTTFGVNGRVTADFDAFGPADIERTPQGRVVVLGGPLTRLNLDGTPDATFGNAGPGVATFPEHLIRSPLALAVGGDARNYVLGFTNVVNNPLDSVIAIKPDGTTDLSFSGDGHLIGGEAFGSTRIVRINDIVALGANNFMVVGSARDASGKVRAVAMAFKPDGTLNTSFAAAGVLWLSDSANSAAQDAQPQTDGSVFVHLPGEQRLARIKDGRVTLRLRPPVEVKADLENPPASTPFFRHLVATRSDGKILVTGRATRGMEESLLNWPAVGDYIARFNADGSPDLSFNGTGIGEFFGAIGGHDAGYQHLLGGANVVAVSAVFGDTLLSAADIVATKSTSQRFATLSADGTLRLDDMDFSARLAVRRDGSRIVARYFENEIRFDAVKVKQIVLQGGEFSDFLRNSTSLPATLAGGHAFDTLIGGSAADRLDAGDQADELDRGGGSDLLLGGRDRDRFFASTGNDTLRGGDGLDVVDLSRLAGNARVSLNNKADDGVGSQKMDVMQDVENIAGGNGNDRLVGSPFTTHITGGAGNDTIFGGAGRNLIDGGLGNDSLDGQGEDDELVGGGGNDTYIGGAGVDFLDFSLETRDLVITQDNLSNDGPAGARWDVRGDIESIHAGAGDDRMVGSGVDNILIGGDGDDTLLGMGGDDTLVGDFISFVNPEPGGSDSLAGGKGNDTIFSHTTAPRVEAPGIDTIDGGAGRDLLDASGACLVLARDGEQDTIHTHSSPGGPTDTLDVDAIDGVF